jgi:hypothetical protein
MNFKIEKGKKVDLKNLPNDVQDYITKKIPDSTICYLNDYPVYDGMPDDIYLAIDNSWDMSDENIDCYTMNLKKIHSMDFMGGVNCSMYKKSDNTKPAYIMYTYFQQDEKVYIVKIK